MPFALIGFFVGIQYLHIQQNTGMPNLIHSNSLIEKITLIVLCMIFARSAAMAFNRFLDHRIDAKNPRTATREIPAGIIKPGNALLFTIICCMLFIATCYFINTLCFQLSFVALFIILFYSYTKRFTPLCHFVLGLGLSLAPIGAFLAITNTFEIQPVLFSGIVLSWVSGFDIIYALQDEEFDKQHHLFSIPVLLGKKHALKLSSFLHIITTILVIFVGFYGQMHIMYWIGACIFSGMLLYQHQIVTPNDLSKVNLAFMTVNGIASITFALFVIADIVLHKL